MISENDREALVKEFVDLFAAERLEWLTPMALIPLLARCGGEFPSILEDSLGRVGGELPVEIKEFLEQRAPMLAASWGPPCRAEGAERVRAPLPDKEDVLRRIEEAEVRLGVVFPQSYKDFVMHVPGYGIKQVLGVDPSDGSSSWFDHIGPNLTSYDGDVCCTGPLLNPEHLKPLSDERWNYGTEDDPCWAWAGDEDEPGFVGEIRDRLIPFVEDGAGNAYAFWFDGTGEPKVVDCDHEDVENWERKTQSNFQAYLDDRYSNFLPGATICFTGKLSVTRDEAHAQARALGMIPVDSITKKTKFLVVGEDAGAAKLAKAEALGVKVLDADEGWQEILDNA